MAHQLMEFVQTGQVLDEQLATRMYEEARQQAEELEQMRPHLPHPWSPRSRQFIRRSEQYSEAQRLLEHDAGLVGILTLLLFSSRAKEPDVSDREGPMQYPYPEIRSYDPLGAAACMCILATATGRDCFIEVPGGEPLWVRPGTQPLAAAKALFPTNLAFEISLAELEALAEDASRSAG